MDAGQLGSLSAIELSSALPQFMCDAVCDLFQKIDLNSPPKDEVIYKNLINPLQWILFGQDPATALAAFEIQNTHSNFCGKVFKSGEPAYFCKDCQTDPTCCLCMECFEHSEHKNHKYRLFASGGGGCCDCGDPEAWTSGVFCELHIPSVHTDDEENDPVKSLPGDLALRVQIFFKALLGYCMNILTSSDQLSLPDYLKFGKSAASLQQDSCIAYLYNDEIHSYDEVIFTLTHKVNLTHTEAVALATYVDRKGRAVIKAGNKQECQQVVQQINSDVRLPLKVEVFHRVVALHQDSAIICLSLIKDLAEKTAAFRRIISQVLVDTSFRPWGLSVLDEFFISDNSLWISARIAWHRLVMGSIFMDTSLKKHLAISLSRNYIQLQKNFVADSHHHDVCASNMTVQIFTAPSLSRMLVLEHGLLSVILKTLRELLAPCKDPATGCLKLRPSNYKHSRIFYIVYDLRYVLRTKPEEWTEPLRKQVLEAYDGLLELVSWLQNADPVHRQRQMHVEREEPWEHCFNFSILMQPAVLLFLEWCLSDAIVLQKALSATCEVHRSFGRGKAKIEFKSHNCEKSIVGRSSMELIMFDILKEAVSVHQPLPRMIATLLSGAHQHELSLTQLLEISPNDQQVPLFLMEYASRAIVMAVQVMAGMWKRNGYSVVNQIINYQYHHSREIMYDKDILMLQSMASILDPEVFMYALVYKFRLEKWLSSPDSDPSKRGEPTDDALRFFISEAEEFLLLILVIFTERHVVGVGENVTKDSILKREVIHRLFISPLSHSEIVKQLKLNDSDCDVDAILSEVATLRRQHGSGGKHVYHLKPQYEEECCPFFYHYTKPDHSKAEEIRRKKFKALAASQVTTASPPLRPPPFTPPYLGVMRLAQSSVLHRMLHCILKQASTAESKFWSDKLLHETLYLCGVILVDEDPKHPNSLCNAAVGMSGKYPFLTHLETLRSHQRAEEHQSLLEWSVQHLRTKKTEMSGNSDMETDGSQGDESKEMTDAEREAQERRDRGLKKRAKLMSQISIMQKEFLKEHRKELDKIDLEDDDGYGAYVGTKYQHDCAVGASSLLHHVSFRIHTTCILCQEEAKDFAKQKKPYVQAINVQRSSLLSRDKLRTDGAAKLCDYSKVDFITSRWDLPHGVFTGGCGHHMHAECWKSFLDNKRVEHARHHFFPLPGQSVEWESGEFLCPLCQCYSNTVVPLVPQVGQLSVGLQLAEPIREVTMEEWKKMLWLAIELASGDNMDTGVSVDPTFLDKLESLFPGYKKPSVHLETNEDKLAADMQEVFSQSVFMCAYGVNPDASDERVPLAQWHSCAYVISSLENNARRQDKFLLSADTLSSRQFNVVRSLVRLGSESKIRLELSALAKQLQFLLNCFLLEDPPFLELPSILDLNCFVVFVNLHFSISALFISLSSPYGRCAPLEGDPVILQLMGITSAHLVRLAAAAHVVQFLLTYTTVGQTLSDVADDGMDQDLPLSDGIGLQKLWVKYRRIANLPYEGLPNPNDLSVCLRQHMFPFLQCTALFLYCLTGIDFVHSSATTAMQHEDLCKYIGLPCNLCWLFDVDAETPSSDPTAQQLVSSIARNWCTNPKLNDLLNSPVPPPILQGPKELQELPTSYSELVIKAASFQCSKRVVEENYGDDGQAAMMCLICGAMLCTNSYCCQAEVESENAMDDKKTRIGGFTQHTQRCGAGIGIALWILESYVVLLDATDVHNVKGCTLTPPYLDEYGETDPGLRRGNPLKLNPGVYEELKQVWFQHCIPERIRKEMEGNPGLMRIRWDHM